MMIEIILFDRYTKCMNDLEESLMEWFLVCA